MSSVITYDRSGPYVPVEAIGTIAPSLRTVRRNVLQVSRRTCRGCAGVLHTMTRVGVNRWSSSQRASPASCRRLSHRLDPSDAARSGSRTRAIYIKFARRDMIDHAMVNCVNRAPSGRCPTNPLFSTPSPRGRTDPDRRTNNTQRTNPHDLVRHMTSHGARALCRLSAAQALPRQLRKLLWRPRRRTRS